MTVKRKQVHKKHTSAHKHHEGHHDETNHHVHKHVKKMKCNGVCIVLSVLLLISLIANGIMFSKLNPSSGLKSNNSAKVSENAAKLDLYVMSQCPYGVQAMDEAIEAKKLLGSDLDLNIIHIFYDKEMYSGKEDQYCIDELCGMHGVNEVKGDIVQLCALNQDKVAALDMISCMNKDYSQIPNNWESCAQEANLDVNSIKTCYEGDQGYQLGLESKKVAKDIGASGSPTIYLNDETYVGGRKAIDFERTICDSFGTQKPESCSQIPEPVKVEVTVLSSKDCASCDTTQLKSAIKNLFPGAVFTEVDVNSADGKELIQKYDTIEVLPVYIFDSSLENTEMIKTNPTFMGAFDALSDGSYKITDSETGSSYYYDEEKRAEIAAKKGITLGDNRPQIDFFVMSYCPYGNQAEEGLAPVYELLKDYADFNPRYIYYSGYGGGGSSYCIDSDDLYCSMHGVQEANQNIRELCVKDEYGTQAWFDFALKMNSECNSGNADTCWQAVASDLGYDTSIIESCEAEKNIEYAAQDLELASVFGARGSPSVYIDGETYSGGRTPADYLSAICSKFDDAPDACNTELEGTTTEVPAGSCG
jgi:glutaredoxin